MIRSLILSIAFFLLLRCKCKIGSTTKRKMTVNPKIKRRKWVFLSTWPLLGGSHLDFCFQIDVWWENEDVVFLMVMEDKQNKGSCLEIRLGLMGYGKLRIYQIFYGSFRLVMGCAYERRRKNMGFWC